MQEKNQTNDYALQKSKQREQKQGIDLGGILLLKIQMDGAACCWPDFSLHICIALQYISPAFPYSLIFGTV
jgi:hypothetical protein